MISDVCAALILNPSSPPFFTTVDDNIDGDMGSSLDFGKKKKKKTKVTFEEEEDGAGNADDAEADMDDDLNLVSDLICVA